MLTYSLRSSLEGREVVSSEFLLSGTSAVVLSTTDSGATSNTATTAATTATASITSVTSLNVLLILLSLEGKEIGELGLANSNVVDLLILNGVNNGLNSVSGGLNSLETSLLGSIVLVGSTFLLES
jgi:hypothetical protein